MTDIVKELCDQQSLCMLCYPKKEPGTWNFSSVFLFYKTLEQIKRSFQQQLATINTGEGPTSFPGHFKKMATVTLKQF